jgi:ATP-dependent Lon protease
MSIFPSTHWLFRKTLTSLQNIKEGIEGHAANWYSDVFDLVFPDLDSQAANDRWKKELAVPEGEGEKKKQRDEDD